MKIELKPLDEFNTKDCIMLRVSDDQAQYIDTNEKSIAAAKEHPDVARPFVIYADDAPVGFTMFAFDENYDDPNDRYWLWRFMIDGRLQGNGYGTVALQVIIRYFRDHGANNIRLSTKESNINALTIYRNAGFRDTGEVNDGEIVLQLDL